MTHRSHSDDIAFLDAKALVENYRSGALSPVDVASSLLDRIGELDQHVNAFVHLDKHTTLEMARRSEIRWRADSPLGPLDGVPVSIKDLVSVEGWPLVRGSPALRGDPCATTDAPAVARLREAGAVFIGKTATPDAGSKIVTHSLVHGVTRNPYDLSRTPGGSSGGAAAALALGIGPLALGTDGAGSIRIPAAWTGIFGLKPTFGRVPIAPPSLFMPHSVLGPMARRVDDAMQMLSVISGPEPRDPFAWPVPFDPMRASQPSVRGLRVGVTLDFGVKVPAGMSVGLDAVRRAAAALESSGAIITDVAPQWPSDPYDSFIVFWEATYAGMLATGYSPEKAARMDPDLLAIAERGTGIDIVTYHRALSQRLALTAASRAIFTEFDLLLGPVMPCGPPSITKDAPEGFEPDDWRWCPFTYLWNMTSQPAASVPWGLDDSGLPVGVQLVGRAGEEPDLIRASRAIEAEGGGLTPRPALLSGARDYS